MDRENGKPKLTNPLALLSRYKYVLLVAALGALLLLWPGTDRESDPSPALLTPSESGSLRETESAMAAILEKINGVGRAEVMLTLQSGTERILAEDTTLRYSGAVQSPDDYERSVSPITDSGGVVVTQENYPQYRGALVVCDGGSNDAVRLKVVEAVAALTGLGADRISVVPWRSET